MLAGAKLEGPRNTRYVVWVEVNFSRDYSSSIWWFRARITRRNKTVFATRSVYELEDWNCSCKKVIEKQAEPERDNEYQRAEGEKSRYYYSLR